MINSFVAKSETERQLYKRQSPAIFLTATAGPVACMMGLCSLHKSVSQTQECHSRAVTCTDADTILQNLGPTNK